MRRKAIVAALGLAAIAGGFLPAHAMSKTVTVDIAAFQYAPSGRITTDPLDPIVGSPAIPAGTPLSTPNLHRGDTLSFVNHDAMAHKVVDANGNGSDRWVALNVAAGGTTVWTIPATFPMGDFLYFCSFHPGMRGSFIVS